jgi:O-antigen/teichoic acid export membrane protein
MNLNDKFYGDSITAVLARGASTAFILNISGAGLAFALHVFLARVLGSQEYGNYIYAFAWMQILMLFGLVGMDTAAVRFVATYTGLEDWERLRGFIVRSLQIVVLASFIVSFLFALGVVILLRSTREELTVVLSIAACLLPLNALMVLVGAMIRGYKLVVMAMAPQFILHPVVVGLGIAGFLEFISQESGAASAMFINVCATTLILMLMGVYLYRITPPPVKQAGSVSEVRHWILVALPLFMISAFHLIISQTDIIMIGYIIGTQESGMYAVASRIAKLIGFGLVAVNVIAAPLIAQLNAQKKTEELQGMLALAAVGILAFSIPVSIVLIIWGREILALFGTQFTYGYPALVILTVGQLVNAFSGPVGFIMTMTGRHVEASYVIGGSAALNVILNAALIPSLGIIGAAVATSITVALWNFTLVCRVKSQLNIHSTIFGHPFFRRATT